MSGIGNINNSSGVGYTEMTGLGLTAETQTQVKQEATVSDAISAEILKALGEFRADGVFNPTTAQMEAKLSAANTGGLNAHQWLTKELGNSLRDTYSLGQWGEMAQKLAVNAAKKRSELSIGNGGGIQQVNGQYFVNGQEMSLSQVNFCVRANQYQLIDQQIADQMDAIQRNNAKAKQTQAVLAAFKAWDGENIGVNQSASANVVSIVDGDGGGSWGALQHYMNSNFNIAASSTPSYADVQSYVERGTIPAAHPELATQIKGFFATLKAAAPDFYSSHITDTNGSGPYRIAGGMTNADFGNLKTAFNTYLSSNSTDNQVAQQRLEALNNSRQAILDGMSAFTQGQSQVTDRIGGNL